MRSSRIVAIAGLALTACYSGGSPLTGLALRHAGDHGPRIHWDPFATPLPEIPFPNDIGTRSDPTSPTGRRLNVSLEASTDHERQLRRLIDGLDGFGTYAPITVKFDSRIDIVDLQRIQSDADPTNDGIYLINVDPSSPHFGDTVPVVLGGGPKDLGKTPFPVVLERPSNYFDNDPRSTASNLLFETVDEDKNHNGVLDPGEDTDGDGVLDVANLWGEVLGDGYAHLDDYVKALAPLGLSADEVHQYFDLITFYELQTNTLIIRPRVPLDQETTYAVVLTRNIVGADSGSPIVSPFPSVNHTEQTAALMPLVSDGLLQKVGVDLDNVAFAWSFTTESITQPLETIRAGLYGKGTMAYLANEFPPQPTGVDQVDVPERAKDGNVYILGVDRFLQALQLPQVQQALGVSPSQAVPVMAAYHDYIDYFVFMTYDSPAFLENADGVFQVDAQTGQAHYGHAPVYLTCAVPKARAGKTPPFPVAFYGHGYTSARFEFLGFAGSLGRFGVATCALDAYGHGLSQVIAHLVTGILSTPNLQLGLLAKALFKGRARDLNNDGIVDSGGDFWTANTFHTRDVVRQTMVDYFQAVRVLRHFGQTTMPVDITGDGHDTLSGDFNGDGIPDFGGPDVNYSVFGASLGGILSGVLGSAEPAFRAAAPISGGSGLTDIAVRSVQGGVVQAVFLPMLGPLIVGIPDARHPGRIDVQYDILDVNHEAHLTIASVPDPGVDAADAIEVGDHIRATNLRNHEVDEVEVLPPTGTNPPGRFRLHLPADKYDPVRIELFRAGATTPYRTIDTFERDVSFQGETFATGEPLELLQEGFGLRRQTPALRRLLGIAQMVLDPADPANWAPFYAHPVAMRPDGAVATNLLVVPTVGDMNVPVNTGIAEARDAGILTPEQDRFIEDTWTMEGLEKLRRFAVDGCRYDPSQVLFDIDDESNQTDPDQGPHPEVLTPNPACDGSADEPVFCKVTCAVRPPVRATVHTPSGVSGMRIPFLKRTGIHGINLPQPSRPFDYNAFEIDQIGWFFATGGHELSDAPCMADYSGGCPFY